MSLLFSQFVSRIPLPTWTLVLVLVVLTWLCVWLWTDVIYRYIFSPFRSVPHAKGTIPFLGHMPTMLADPARAPVAQWMATTIPHRTGFYRIFMGPYEWLMPATPAAIAAIANRPFDFVMESKLFEVPIPSSLLVCKVQNIHRSLRKLYVQSLGKARAAANTAAAWATGERMRARLFASLSSVVDSSSSTVVDVHKAVLVANTETMLRLCFSLELDCASGSGPGVAIAKAMDDFVAAIGRDGWLGTLMWILTSTVMSYKTLMTKTSFGSMIRYRRGNAFLRNFIRAQLRERKLNIEGKEGGIETNDILGLFLAAGPIEEESLIDQLLTLLFAGRDNTASVVSWALFELAQNPDIQTRLRDELETEYAANWSFNTPTAAQLNSLPYLRAVTMETIRLYPFFTAFTAEAAQDTNIEDLAVPAGTQLCMPLWAIGRQTSLWGPDAAVFRPERWIESANGGASSPLAFMSFMHGPRQCPGKEYAITNSMALLSSMVRGFEWEKVDGRQGCVGCGFLLSPKGGMQLRMSAVEKC